MKLFPCYCDMMCSNLDLVDNNIMIYTATVLAAR